MFKIQLCGGVTLECKKRRQMSSAVFVNPLDASLGPEILRSIPLPTVSLLPENKDIANGSRKKKVDKTCRHDMKLI